MEWHGYSSEQVVLKNYLEHHGVKGQRWGVRRYQNADGTLTERGKKKLRSLNNRTSNAIKSGLIGAAASAGATVLGNPHLAGAAALGAVTGYNKSNKKLNEQLKKAPNAYAPQKEIDKVQKQFDKNISKVDKQLIKSYGNHFDINRKLRQWDRNKKIINDGKSRDSNAIRMYDAMIQSLYKIGNQRLKDQRLNSNVTYTQLESYKKQNVEIKKSINDVIKRVGDMPLNKIREKSPVTDHEFIRYSRWKGDVSGKAALRDAGWKY